VVAVTPVNRHRDDVHDLSSRDLGRSAQPITAAQKDFHG
jgi:hypothetical protein